MHDLNGSLREVKKLKFSLPQGTSPNAIYCYPLTGLHGATGIGLLIPDTDLSVRISNWASTSDAESASMHHAMKRAVNSSDT